MQGPFHVVVEDYDSYRERKRQDLIFSVKAAWYLLVAFVIWYLVQAIIKNSDIAVYVAFVAFVFFIAAELSKPGYLKSVVKVFLGFMYLSIAILFAISVVSMVVIPSTEQRAGPILLGATVTILFLYFGYRNIKKYSNIIEVIFGRFSQL